MTAITLPKYAPKDDAGQGLFSKTFTALLDLLPGRRDRAIVRRRVNEYCRLT